MIYRGPGFLTLIWCGSSPIPSHSNISKLDRRHTGRLKKIDNFLMGEYRGKGVGEEPNHTSARKPGRL